MPDFWWGAGRSLIECRLDGGEPAIFAGDGLRGERVTTLTRTVHPGQTPDLAWAMLEFASGAIGVLETSWLAPVQGGVFTDDALSIIGSRGAACIDLSRAPLSFWNESGYALLNPFYSPVAGGKIAGAFRGQLIAFITGLRSGRPSTAVPLDDVRHGLAVALAGGGIGGNRAGSEVG